MASFSQVALSGSSKSRVQARLDLILLDYRLPDIDGLQLIADIKTLNLNLPLIVLTGQGDEKIAVEIMKGWCSRLSS